MGVVPATGQKAKTGTFPNEMEYVTWGDGPRTFLLIPVGPGSVVPDGMMLRMSQGLFQPLVDAGFAVWVVTRRRNMPAGHTVADMADDYAQLIAEEFGGRVDLVVGESLGGMIGQYLAAFHSDTFRSIALVAAGCEASAWGKEVDARLASAAARGDSIGAGAAFAEYVLPGDRMRWIRRLLAPAVGRLLISDEVPPEDFLVEQRAEDGFDSRPVLPHIRVPVLLLCGDRDRYFTRDVVEETARLIPECTLIWYRGQGHLRAATNKRIAKDLLAFVRMQASQDS